MEGGGYPPSNMPLTSPLADSMHGFVLVLKSSTIPLKLTFKFYRFIWLHIIAMPIITPNFDYRCNFAIEVQNSKIVRYPSCTGSLILFWVIGKKLA
jgi:hypothetical protein